MAILTVKPRFRHRVLLGVLLAVTVHSQTAIGEYQVKAAFLYNFAKFSEWPPQTFKTDKDPMRICVLGENSFGSALGEAVGGKTVSGRPFVVAEISDAKQAGDCQIVFVGSSEGKRLKSIFAELRTTGTLTVGETDGFAAKGGMVNFKLEDGRVRLEINVEAAGQAQIHISSKVLTLARIVKCGAQK
jgi:hypothetical protein